LGRAAQGEEGLSGGAQGDVVAPAAPGAALEVVQAHAVPKLAVVVLDPPAIFAHRARSVIGVVKSGLVIQ
jgi:hypothetical protein